ncbi:MAG TPA: HAMP domain-containing sensor histidine kinase [Opitutaceae bacterium]
MNRREATSAFPSGFRAKLMAAMMLVVSVITALALYFANRDLELSVESSLQQQFRTELTALHNVQQLRLAALVERCRTLVRRPRIQAALEDGALDLLYPSARDELRDVVQANPIAAPAESASVLSAEFYRFLDRNGALIPPQPGDNVGRLAAEFESRLTLAALPDRRQIGWLARTVDNGATKLSEIMAMPIVSLESGEAIAALVLGFAPVDPPEAGSAHTGIMRGILVEGRLFMPGAGGPAIDELAPKVLAAIAGGGELEGGFTREIGGVPHQVFFKLLNPDSLYPPAHEVCVYPLAELVAKQRQLRWRVLGAGGLLLLGALGASVLVSRRLAVPVEQLAVDSERNLEERARAEAALEATSAELQRAARFSADASHQLKTPVAVLRAGLDELRAHSGTRAEHDTEVSSLIHQTYRLSSIIDELLLLSRMDAGQLKLTFGAVNLSRLIEASLDDLGAQPGAAQLEIEPDFPADLRIAGDSHYAGLILQNLLENARKYNRPGGRIRLIARAEDGMVRVSIGNTGTPIPPESQVRIFERFHRGAVGENLPGYGLGLNLARELARLHQGTLRLVGSTNDWTEFELRLCVPPPGGDER